MSRYVDPRTGEPQTAYSELTQTEWALFIDDDWKVRSNFTLNLGLRYENYGTFKDSDDTLRNLIFGSGSTYNERLASARVDFVDQFYPTDNNNFGPRVGFAWDPKGDGKMSVRGGYGLAYDRLMNLPAENYRHSPPLRATVVLGQFFGTPQFTYSLGDPSKPYLGYPVDPALQVGLDERNGVKGARVALTTVDPDLVNPYTHNWFLGVQREIGLGVVADFNYLGSSGPQPVQRLQPEPLCRRLAGRDLQRLQPELPADQHGDVDVEVGLPGRHHSAPATIPAGVHGSGGVHIRQGDE